MICLKKQLALGLAWSSGRIIDKQEQLFAVEKAHIEKAVRRRQEEFRAGRTCAREALKLLGHRQEPIPVLPDRAPRWPKGFVGSISHSKSWAISIVGFSDSFLGLGIDLIEVQSVDRNLYNIILTHAEHKNFPDILMFETKPVDKATAIFSIKEAVFKAIYPMTGIMLDFQDVSVEAIIPETHRYRARLHVSQDTIERIGSNRIEGSIGYAEHHLVATLVVHRNDVAGLLA